MTNAPVVEKEAAGVPPSMVDRMTRILDAFDSTHQRLPLEEVVRRCGLPRSTTHRILTRLVELSWLDHTATGYALGGRARMGGGTDAAVHEDVRRAASPWLSELQLTTGLVVHLAVLDGDHVRYLDKLGGRFARTVPSKVGERMRAHCTALGKAMLAWLPAEEVDLYIGPAPQRHTQRTIGSRDVLHQELRRVRERRGIAFERGECVPDIACVASAVRGHDGPIAAVSVTGDLRAPLERLVPPLVQATTEIGRALRGDPVQAPRPEPAPAETWSADALGRMMAIGAGGDWL
ncbi:DNA-binding IclR family transcriptional regulator [Nocardioides massiliensis]|uniref:DNA-binding IclR family transcriptional regulator n=2 Tax=Nocardioides massiliensis TaxID=1325935 RepID=A0ABT9NKA0_9ACTN|nr:IclR family transcriptional regulator [Nocardioides massiliensis]MDP9820838.1 DNA-binding IclR family transcriptional regulator [Nocardioides massiliensis]